MCRSAIEFPPNGKRCGHGDHLSEANKAAWKVKRAARERELYYIRKARKAGDAEQNTVEPDVNAHPGTINANNFHEVVDSLIENHVPVVPVNNFSAVYAKEYGSLVNISKDPSALAAGSALDDESISHEQSRNIAAHILSNEQPELAYMEITGEDEDFYAESVNEVSRVILEDGSIGYFKNYKAATWDARTQNDYGHDVLQTFNNEVVAYRLTQIMGDGYSDLVPVTVLREYNGQLGSLQAEAAGVVGAHSGWADYYRECSYSQLRKAALFDYLAGSQDRHGFNYAVVDNGRNGKDELVLIDNGFSFPSEEHVYKNALKISAMMMDATNDEGIKLTAEEQNVVEKVRASMKNGELSNLLSKEQKAYMSKRIDLLMETKRLDRDNYSAFMSSKDY